MASPRKAHHPQTSSRQFRTTTLSRRGHGHDAAMERSASSNRNSTRWTIRIVPIFITAAFGVTTYVVIGRLCVDYLIRYRGKRGLAAALLALYALVFSIMIAAYLRTFITVQRNPGLVPLISERDANEKESRKQREPSKRRRRDQDVEDHPYIPPDTNPNSPGLEAFYSKDVFVCESDGRPKWCSECRQWKPDRAHHSSELGRCVRKMDHLCPWVGGMVSETSFNFFVQFTFYCGLYCVLCVATTAYCLQQQKQEGRSTDGWIVAVIVMASFFGFFTLGMTLTSSQFIFTNITNVDMLRKSQTFQLAVRIPRDTPPSQQYRTVTYPLEIGPSGPRPTEANAQSDGSVEHISTRDQRAIRKFAILATERRENPWDLHSWGNWKSVMGNNAIEWLLPIKHSPCCNHESMESDYVLGHVLTELRQRYGVPDIQGKSGEDIEMQVR